MDGMAFSDILKVFTQQHPVHTGGAGSQAVDDEAGYALLEFSPSEFLPSSTMPLILTVLAPPGSSCSWLFSYPTRFLLGPLNSAEDSQYGNASLHQVHSYHIFFLP